MVPALGVVGGTPGWAVRRIIPVISQKRPKGGPVIVGAADPHYLIGDRAPPSYMPVT